MKAEPDHSCSLFWKLVESASRSPFPRVALERDLRSLEFEDLVQFQICLRSAIARAYCQPIAAAAYVMLGFLSDNALEDFAAWLLLGGRERFEVALRFP